MPYDLHDFHDRLPGQPGVGDPVSAETLTEMDLGIQAATAAAESAMEAGSAEGAVFHFAVAGVYPGRPITPKRVFWMTGNVVPPAPGTTTSGTGPVPNHDFVLLSPGMTALEA